MNYILLDESWDLGFKLERGSSKYFAITILFTKSKRRLEKIARNTYKSLSKKFKKVGVLHAYKEEPITRTRILSQVNTSDCSILAIIVNKRKVYTKLQDEKAVLYNYVTNILLDRLFTKKPIPPLEPVTLLASRRETKRLLNENFKNYLQNKIINDHKLQLTIEISSPSHEKSLQIVDVVSWAIFRRYEKADDSYYNLIKSKIIEETPLFP
ncbi:MAG: hypothetical protein Athens101426_357 [Parcubacteria group bacterium Athens1014_26]|nr:MAG: hypothetical protein Athens101426_357 [Parcubacteria group bacterium Athens1014_26]